MYTALFSKWCGNGCNRIEQTNKWMWWLQIYFVRDYTLCVIVICIALLTGTCVDGYLLLFAVLRVLLHVHAFPSFYFLHWSNMVANMQRMNCARTFDNDFWAKLWSDKRSNGSTSKWKDCDYLYLATFLYFIETRLVFRLLRERFFDKVHQNNNTSHLIEKC